MFAGGGIWHYVAIALILFMVFFIYLIFTQPKNALYYAERFFVIAFKVVSFLFIGLFNFGVAVGRGIKNMVNRK
jgi:bacteriorhodopsin